MFPPGQGMPNQGMPGQGMPGQGGMPGGPPDNYLVWAILSTVLCCLPFGVVSIINSTKVEKLYYQGDVAGSMAASENAKKWAIISAGVSVVLFVLYILLIAVVGIGEAAT